jgi:hypothetical protein
MTEPKFPPLPEHLRTILAKPEGKPEDQLPTIPGDCRIHGPVGFARFILHDNGDMLAEYCSKCLAKVMSALIGELTYPDEK